MYYLYRTWKHLKPKTKTSCYNVVSIRERASSLLFHTLVTLVLLLHIIAQPLKKVSETAPFAPRPFTTLRYFDILSYELF